MGVSRSFSRQFFYPPIRFSPNRGIFFNSPEKFKISEELKMKRPYRTRDGKIVVIETKPEVAEQLDCLERREASARRKARRHNESSIEERYEQTGWEFADRNANIEANYIEREEKEMLATAIKNLTEKQQRLIRLYYYKNKTESEIAREFGISHQAISKQLAKIHKAIIKFFEKF